MFHVSRLLQDLIECGNLMQYPRIARFPKRFVGPNGSNCKVPTLGLCNSPTCSRHFVLVASFNILLPIVDFEEDWHLFISLPVTRLTTKLYSIPPAGKFSATGRVLSPPAATEYNRLA